MSFTTSRNLYTYQSPLLQSSMNATSYVPTTSKQATTPLPIITSFRLVSLTKLQASDTKRTYDLYYYYSDVNTLENKYKQPYTDNILSVLANEGYTLFQGMNRPDSYDNPCVIITHKTKSIYNFYKVFKHFAGDECLNSCNESEAIVEILNKSKNKLINIKIDTITVISYDLFNNPNLQFEYSYDSPYQKGGKHPTTIRIGNKNYKIYVKHNKEFITVTQALRRAPKQAGTK